MGLTQQQVQERINQGLTNETDLSTDKTTKEIIISNTFTYFNLIFLIITVLLCLVGSFRNLPFLPIVIGNTLIGIIQEVRAKRTLDKMNLLNAPHAIVVRDGVKQKIETEQLVQDDEIILEAGNQICADAVVVEGSVQVNESLLTGEADEVEKNPGDELFSGSFVVSGRCHAELTHVGNESYIAKLSQEAKTMGSGEQSEMIRSINQIVKWVGIVIIPIGLLLFYQSHFINHETIRRSVTATVAAIIGMIPEGLYLLTTIALALSTMKLASRKVLLHDMKSIEALARVDVLCVDKTGTITEPTMNVKQIICSKNGKNLLHTPEELQELLVDYTLASNDNNATMQALRTFAENDGATPHRMVVERYPFSSTTKYGAIVFTEGTYILGAPEFVLRDAYATVEEEITTFTKDGDRVLLFAKYAGTDLKHGLTEEVIPLGFVILANPIRENAKQTFEYFNNQGVAIKVISGDTPVTVSEVARQAGIAHAEDYIDASKYADDALAAETKEAKKANLQAIKDNLVAMFIQSGVADCESLQNIYGPKVEASKTDSAFLKKALNILKLMKCNESEVYFKASEYMYQIDPTADAAVGVAYMYYKKGDYDNAVKYFDEALAKETDNDKKAEMAYATAAALMQAKKLSQARSYCQKAMSFKENYGEPYILLAQLYGSNPNWTDEPALNKCTYFVVIDKLQRAKAVDPSVTERANELISTYSRHTPQAKDLFMLGYKAGDRITIGGWIGESTTIR